MLEHKNYSLADQVFEQLESQILCGQYARGEILTELKLCEAMGVSRTPIREALRRLQQEHLLEDTGKGLKVLGITKEDLGDIMEVRLQIEGMAAARAAVRITDEELKKLQETVDLQEFYLTKKDSDHIKAMDSKFHELIYLYSGSTVFYDTLTPLHNKAQRYRKVSVENRSRARESVQEHRDIYEALAARDPELAAQKMLEHTKNAREHVLKG